MFQIADELRKRIPQLEFRVYTGDGPVLDQILDRAGVREAAWIKVSRLPPERMPRALMECDLALALRKPAFSTQGVAPIKVGEYLLAGLPIIGTSGVGLTEPLIEANVFFPANDDFAQVWPWVRDHVIPNRASLRKEAQRLGLAHFSIENAARSYLRALST
jgi:glycosyltransferase involved in cell wall biosynthesis